MKKIGMLLIILCVIACGGAVVHKINFASDYSPDKIQRLAIVNFDVPNNISMKRDVIVDKFTTALVGSRFKLVDRSDIKKIMAEANFQNLASGVIDENTRQKLKHLGADTVMTGSMHTYTERKDSNDLILYAEVYLTAKMLRVDTGEVLWSAEILKISKAKNVGQKKFIGGETEAESAGKLLDEIVTEMADSFKEKKKLLKYF